jgi:hypothetical protein
VAATQRNQLSSSSCNQGLGLRGYDSVAVANLFYRPGLAFGISQPRIRATGRSSHSTIANDEPNANGILIGRTNRHGLLTHHVCGKRFMSRCRPNLRGYAGPRNFGRLLSHFTDSPVSDPTNDGNDYGPAPGARQTVATGFKGPQATDGIRLGPQPLACGSSRGQRRQRRIRQAHRLAGPYRLCAPRASRINL